jgi:predicted MFS family arabinose efflux permease
MVLNPLGEILLSSFGITTSQFGMVVSGYAFSAGISGILAAGFADRFDRRKMLLFFYFGFIVGTYGCAWAPSFEWLLAARIFTGFFGGVLGAINMAIIADIFEAHFRGRVISYVQMAFGLSQVAGIPIGWELAHRFGWQAPFWMIAVIGTGIGILMIRFVRPVNAHLKTGTTQKNPLLHLLKTIRNPNYVLALSTTGILALGGYLMMPFGSTFSRHNLGLAESEVTILFISGGLISFGLGPLIGKLSDRYGKMPIFYIGSIWCALVVLYYTNMGITPLWFAIIMNGLLFIGIFGRMIPAQALMISVPDASDRGAFMSISSSLQQLSGGVGSFLAGKVVWQQADGTLLHYNRLGWVMIASFIISMITLYFINLQLKKRQPQN